MAVPCVRVPREEGEETRQRLADAGLVSEDYEIEVAEGFLYIPVTDPSAVDEDLTVVSRAVETREGQTMPADLVEELRGVDAPIALVFGREDKGLSNEELSRLDQVAAIPASEAYPVMNLGQAATVTLYELRKLTLEGTQLPDTEPHRAPPQKVERFHDYWDEFLTAMGHREHKHEKTERMFRRLVGRANPTDREITTLLGVLRRATDQLDERKELLDELDEEDELRR